MATVQFRLRSKANKNVSIKIRISLNRENVFECNTGFTVNPKDWSNTTSRPKQNNEVNKTIFNNLLKLELYLLDNLNKDLGSQTIINIHWLESKIKDCFNRIEKIDNGLILTHTQFIIDNANTRKVRGKNQLGLSQNRIKGYVTFKNLLKRYESVIKKELHFIDVNKIFVNKFINWLINDEKYSMNYAGKQIDNLKTVCLDAEQLEIPINPYIKYIQGFSEADDDRFIQTLSFEELEQIKMANITKPELINARNWLLLGCEIGQRGGDLLNITNDNIRYEKGNIYLDIIQQKTGKSITVGIIAPHVIEIIENNLPHKISTQKLNDYIKDVCRVAKIDEVVEGRKMDVETMRKVLGRYPKCELITTHSFRRSFCTNYYKKIPTAILIGISGHSKESLFLSYINRREDKDANAELFMKFYEDIHKEKTPQLKLIKTAK